MSNGTYSWQPPFLNGCQNYGPFLGPILIRHLIFRGPKRGPFSWQPPYIHSCSSRTICQTIVATRAPVTPSQRGVPKATRLLPGSRGPKDHINVRILQAMVSGIPSYWALELGFRILVFIWPVGPLGKPRNLKAKLPKVNVLIPQPLQQ